MIIGQIIIIILCYTIVTYLLITLNFILHTYNTPGVKIMHMNLLNNKFVIERNKNGPLLCKKKSRIINYIMVPYTIFFPTKIIIVDKY